MTKKLEINFTKKPEMVFQFDQFLNVEQAVDKFLNKKENLERLIAPLIPTNLEETIQKLIPEVEDGKTPIKGIDYNDGKDGETPDEETLLELIKTQIPEPIPGNDGKTPKKGVDYFTKKELEDIKKGLKEAIMSEMTNHVTKEEVNIRLEEIKKQVKSLPQSGGAQFLRQLMDVNVGVPTAQQYGLTYNPSRSEFSLTAITGGGAVDSVNGQTGVVVLDADDIDDTSTTNKFVTASDITKLGNLSGTNTGDVTVSDSSEIDLTLTGQQISASIVAGSIDETKLDTSVNASLDLADTALQSSAIGVSVQAYSSVLQNTTASFTTADETKLDNITVTQAVNLDTMESDIAALANGMVYKGNWDASAGTFPGAGAAQTGWFYTVSVGGTVDSVVFNVDDRLVATTDNASTTVYTGNWTKLDATDAVTSVFGRTGNVTATNGDYTASNITNVPAGNIAATDVQAALNELDTEKVTANGAITGATKTKITYDAKGLVTAGADATTADIADSTNKRYVTDADLTDIGNLSGTNTGDQTITNSSDATSHTVTLSASGGSVQLIEGSGITLTTGGTASAGTVTIAASGGSGATTALDNLASVAINTSLVSDTDETDDLGTTVKKWLNIFVKNIGATATRVTKGWFTDLEVTNAIVGSITGNAATATTATTATGTNALYSATTTVDVSAATAPSSGQVLTATSSTAATWQTPSTPVSIKQKIVCCFEDSARLSALNTNGSGSNTIGSSGLAQVTGATSGSSASAQYTMGALNCFDNNPTFSCIIIADNPAGSGSGSTYWGIGSCPVTGSGHTYLEQHIGFKATKVSSTTINLYGTVANGTTETATASLTTIAVNDVIELFFVVTGTSNVAFYWRKNGGALSSATNVTTNIPSGSTNGNRVRFSTSNDSSAVRFDWIVSSFSYER